MKDTNYSIVLTFFKNWGIVALQCYVSFCCTMKWVSYMYIYIPSLLEDFPGGSDGKVSGNNAGDLGLIPGSGRSPGEGNGNPLQYSRLENPMDRGAS